MGFYCNAYWYVFCFIVENETSLLQEACDAILKDQSFKIDTQIANFVVKTASALSTWIINNGNSASKN